MPKFYCEYCGVYLTHSSPSGRKQHCRGRKHINNKIEYYNQLLIDQNQSGLLGNNSLKSTPLNPFARPLLPNIPFNIPGMMPSMNQGPQPNLNTSHINLPGILPSNITSLPLNQDSNKLQWGQNNQMNPQMNMNPLQMNPLQMNPQMNQMNPNMSQMMSGPMGPLQMGQMSLVGQLQGINPMQMNQQNKGIGGFLGNNSNNNNNNQQGPNSNGSFIHPANVGQNPYQKQ